MPAVLKRKPPTQTVRKPAVPIRKPQANQGTDQAKSTDDAYNDFMKEISDLMWIIVTFLSMESVLMFRVLWRIPESNF